MFSRTFHRWVPLVGLFCVLGPRSPARRPRTKSRGPETSFANPSFEEGRDPVAHGPGRDDHRRVHRGRQGCGPPADASALFECHGRRSMGVPIRTARGGARPRARTYTFRRAGPRAFRSPWRRIADRAAGANRYDRAASTEPRTITKDAPGPELHVDFKSTSRSPQGWFCHVSCNSAPCRSFVWTCFRLYEGQYVPYAEAARQRSRGSGRETCSDTGAGLGGTIG